MGQLQLKKAVKNKVKIKIGIQGSAGSGKTYSALKMALGMVGGDINKVAVIDTESGSSALYSDIFGQFMHMELTSPFTPERCIEAINICEKSDAQVIIFDGISHEWIGEGGILDLAEQMSGNSFTNWGKLTPRHNRFINRILSCQKHMICTMRSKQDYIMVENEKGKMAPEKVGMKSVTRDGVDYEFTLNFEVDIKNFAVASKDRTSMYKGKPEFKIDESTGTDIITWCNTGAELPHPSEAQFTGILNYLSGDDKQKDLARQALSKYTFTEKQQIQITELS